MVENEKNVSCREHEIITAAQKVFAEYGYKKVTMDDVAAELNITRSALYYYYKSKDDLFAAVGEYEFGRYVEKLEKAISPAKTTDERFAAFCGCFIPMRTRFRDVYKLGFEDFPFPDEIHIKFKSIIGGIHRRFFTEIFRKDKKICNIADLDYYSTLLTYSIRGVVFNSSNTSLEQLESDIIKLCKIFCHGIPGVASVSSNDSVKKDK
jgi:AcrR family transcriptional regulator